MSRPAGVADGLKRRAETLHLGCGRKAWGGISSSRAGEAKSWSITARGPYILHPCGASTLSPTCS